MQTRAISVYFTPAEVSAIGELINVAVKSAGLPVAAAALQITQKLQQAVAQAQIAEQPELQQQAPAAQVSRSTRSRRKADPGA